MSRADASLHEYMNKLRRSRDARSASSTRPGVGGGSVYNGSRGGGLMASLRKGVGLTRKSGWPSRAIPNDLRANLARRSVWI
ncbi:hypothetical protein ACSQ67_023654 [Phaseolus vulgaris]